MAAKRNFKLVNEGSEDIVAELLVDSENVFFHQTPDAKLFLIGYYGNNIRFVPVLNPANAQVIELNDRIINSQPSLLGIYLLLASNQIQLFENSINGKWTSVKCFDFINPSCRSLEVFLPVADGFFLCTRSQNSLIVSRSISSDTLEIVEKAAIDTFVETGSPYLCLSPQSKKDDVTLLIGTAEGHIYQLSSSGGLALLCDIQQPTLSIHVYLDEVFVIGKNGKIVRLNCRSKAAHAYFAPSSVVWCGNAGRSLYLQSPTELYSAEMKDGELCEFSYCPVQSVRAPSLSNQSVFVLAESGAVYQVDPQFESGGRKWSNTGREGEEIKILLEEIHRCSDQTKQLNLVDQKLGTDLEQVSAALQMLNCDDIVAKFRCTIQIFSSSDCSEVLHLCISNESSWSFSSSHWSIQVSVTGSESVRFCHQFSHEWRSNTELKTEHLLQNQETQLAGSNVQVSLIFRPELKLQSLCAFPIARRRIELLDVLHAIQPVKFQQLVDTKSSVKVKALLGMNKAAIPTDSWRLLLRNCWHRGFSLLDSPDCYQEPVTARYGLVPIRLTLTAINSVLILRIETYEKKLLDGLRTEMFQLLQANIAGPKPQFVRVPAQTIAHIQNLRSRLNYTQSLGNDTDSLQEEFEMLMAQHFPIV